MDVLGGSLGIFLRGCRCEEAGGCFGCGGAVCGVSACCLFCFFEGLRGKLVVVGAFEDFGACAPGGVLLEGVALVPVALGAFSSPSLVLFFPIFPFVISFHNVAL